jgi:hypothetical protein
VDALNNLLPELAPRQTDFQTLLVSPSASSL